MTTYNNKNERRHDRGLKRSFPKRGGKKKKAVDDTILTRSCIKEI